MLPAACRTSINTRKVEGKKRQQRHFNAPKKWILTKPPHFSLSLSLSRSAARLSSNFADPFRGKKGKRKGKRKKGTDLSLSLSLSRNTARLSSNFADTFLPKQRDNVKTEGKHPIFKHAIWSM
jgi:hypothetical protein